MYERRLLSVLRKSRASLLLLGPRQVGKSTLLRELEPQLAFNLADPGVHRRFAARPESIRELLAAQPPSTKTVLIDEVQRVPELLDALQVVLDEQPKRFRFLLSGSSARKLRRGGANLLPGRVVVHALHPLFERELADDFVLDRALAHGTLPATWTATDASERAELLQTYADVYLREEIQAEALVRDLGGYSRMLDLVAAASGTILNTSALCRDAEIRYETARRYLEILEDTLVLLRIPAWSGSDRSSLVAHPKIFLFDTGVRNALLGRPLDKPLPDERGILLEHFVAHELHRRIGHAWRGTRLFHYRTKHGSEVDFVLEVDRELWGIEVKSTRTARPGMLSGLNAFAERSPRVKRRILLTLAEHKSRMGAVEVWPVRAFLASLP